ncbi:MAG: hypothetical protein RL329_3773 [Bacteroidota bacterium]|jgi:hypothetical protein
MWLINRNVWRVLNLPNVILYFTHDGFAIEWMYGFHGFAPIGTDFKKNPYQSVRIREIRTSILSQNHPTQSIY